MGVRHIILTHFGGFSACVSILNIWYLGYMGAYRRGAIGIYIYLFTL